MAKKRTRLTMAANQRELQTNGGQSVQHSTQRNPSDSDHEEVDRVGLSVWTTVEGAPGRAISTMRQKAALQTRATNSATLPSANPTCGPAGRIVSRNKRSMMPSVLGCCEPIGSIFWTTSRDFSHRNAWRDDTNIPHQTLNPPSNN